MSSSQLLATFFVGGSIVLVSGARVNRHHHAAADRRSTDSNSSTASTLTSAGSFSVVHYNILARYLGSNKEPWFLYDSQVDGRTRKKILSLSSSNCSFYKKVDGKYVNKFDNGFGGCLNQTQREWVRQRDKDFRWEMSGGLTAEVVHRWWRNSKMYLQGRREKIVQELTQGKPDIISAVELDEYTKFFRSRLKAEGYESVYHRRPRKRSQDGCGIFWREDQWELAGPEEVSVRRVTFADITPKDIQDPIKAFRKRLEENIDLDDVHGLSSIPKRILGYRFLEFSTNLRLLNCLQRLTNDGSVYYDRVDINNRKEGCGHFIKYSDETVYRRTQDRGAIFVHLRHRDNPDRQLVVVSTHLMRNPEDIIDRELVRMTEAVQLLRALDRFLQFRDPCRQNVLHDMRLKFGVLHQTSPLVSNCTGLAVVLAGDMNAYPKKKNFGLYWLLRYIFDVKDDWKYVERQINQKLDEKGYPFSDFMLSGGAITTLVKSGGIGVRSREIVDAFTASHHSFKKRSKRCTSKTEMRESIIDYIFFSKKMLRVESYDVESCPKHAIPDATHPSDHIPLRARFQWL